MRSRIIGRLKKTFRTLNVSLLMFRSSKRAGLLQKWNPTHTEYERDENAIRGDIDSNINEKDLESWIRDTYEGLVENKGISNGVDPYTPSGNRRSFRATHYAFTLDNVVRAMREQQAEKGANAFAETGFTAVSTKDFKNIDDIHANEDSIQSLSEEEYKSLRKNIDEIANRIKNTRSGYDLSYLTVIADAARARHTAKEIESYLRNAGMKVYEGVGQEILDLKQEASMLPACYFEAKPMRAVGLGEIADVIAPDTVSDELKQALESNNIPYELYKAGDNAERTQNMNAHENLRLHK